MCIDTIISLEFSVLPGAVSPPQNFPGKMMGGERNNRSRKRKKTAMPHQSPKATAAAAAEEPSSSPPATAAEEESESESERGGEWRDWSSLTSPLLLSILSLLHTLQDSFAFRGVCRSWRSLSPVSSTLSPLLLLTRAHLRSKALYDPAARRPYRAHLPWDLSTRHTLSYSHGHLITSTPLSSPPHKPLLFNLLTGAQIRLPKTPLPFHRLLLSSSPSSPSCRALLLHPAGSPLQLCRPAVDRRWSVHRFGGILRLADAIFHRGELYALTDSGWLGVVRFSPEEEDEPEFVIVPGESMGKVGTDMRMKNSKWFLAECGDERLLLVCIRFFGRGWHVKIDVQAWDFEQGRWAKLAGLGNKAIFFGSTGFTGWLVGLVGSGVRENCVYCCTNYPKNEWVVYSLEDQVGEIMNAYDAPDVDRNWAGEHPVWVFPSIS